MRKIFILLFLPALFLNCSKPKKVLFEKLQNRNGVFYEINSQTPFSGLAASYYENGQLEEELSYKNGERNGIFKIYYENGQLAGEGNYKNGRLDGIFKSYYENGQLARKVNYKNGRLISD